MRRWSDFLDWWLGSDKVLGYSKVRVTFLTLEVMHAAYDPAVSGACVDEGYLTREQLEEMRGFVDSFDTLNRDSKEHVITSKDLERMDANPHLRTFRSWYKGGDEVTRREEARGQAQTQTGVGGSRHSSHSTTATAAATAHTADTAADTANTTDSNPNLLLLSLLLLLYDPVGSLVSLVEPAGPA
jgi:hypothetical protein